jgi:GNAT superfamily N-acetyltransferase
MSMPPGEGAPKSARPVARIRRPRAGDFAADADATATLYLASRRAMLPNLRDPHTEAETRAWMRDIAFARYSVRLVEVDGEIVGFAARDGAWLMQLYVKPGWTGRGIGSKLLELILAEAATATPILRLHTFARNAGALRFYERHGFVAVAFGDGTGNEEGEPDVRYERPTRS